MTNFLHDLADLLANELHPIDIPTAWPVAAWYVGTYKDEPELRNALTGEAFDFTTLREDV